MGQQMAKDSEVSCCSHLMLQIFGLEIQKSPANPGLNL